MIYNSVYNSKRTINNNKDNDGKKIVRAPNACRQYENGRLLEIYNLPSPDAHVELIEELNDNIELRGTRAIKMNKKDEEAFAATGRDIRLHRVGNGPTETIHKNRIIEHEQKVKIRYLKPPTPPAGKIILKEQPRKPIPAPNLAIRLPCPEPITPEPIIIRQAPPRPPSPVSDIVIPIKSRDHLLPRKLILEKMLPYSKPPPIIIEKWLPYKQAKREVIFEPAYLKEPIPKENPTLLCPLQYKMQYYVPVQSCIPMQNCEPIQNYAPIQNYEPMQSCIPMPSCVPMPSYEPMQSCIPMPCCVPIPSYEPMQNYVQTKICFPL